MGSFPVHRILGSNRKGRSPVPFSPFFALIVASVIIQRGIELRIAAAGGRALAARGAVEAGRAHYPWIVAIHVGFFISLIVEVWLMGPRQSVFWPAAPPFLAAQGLRFWSMRTLGPFWNTRIWVLPGQAPIQAGPYRFIRHPNYVAVTIEIATLPLIFHAFWTAAIFTVLNYAALSHRVQIEEDALASVTDYAVRLRDTPRGLRWWNIRS